MKNVRSILAGFIVLFACTTVISCDDLIPTSTTYKGIISGHAAESGQQAQDFYLSLTLYDDDTFMLMTALTGSDLSLSSVKTQAGIVEILSDGFTIKASGKTIAKGSYVGKGEIKQEIRLDWDMPICEEWEKYSEQYGWEKPCLLREYVDLIDDIIGY